MIEGLASRCPEKTFYLGQVFNDTTNSYKLVWFLAILSLLRRRNEANLPLVEILTEMAAIAWHPVCLFRLSLGRQDKLQDAILEIRQESVLPPNTPAESIRKFVESSPEMQARLECFKRYVPTRFLTPWFAGSLRGEQDSQRQRRILELAKASQTTPSASLYWLEARSVHINDSWRAFLTENMAVVQGFAEQHFAHYLQARNPNVPGIVNKLRAPTERDLKVAREFWQFVQGGFRGAGEPERFRDIYTERPLVGRFAIDHFLPWSFVAHDLMWNLAPVETVTNSKKGDILPDLDVYLPRLVSLHVRAIEVAKKRPKLLQDYTESFKLDVPGLLALGENGLGVKYREVMSSQGQIAINQGFQSGWRFAEPVIPLSLGRRPAGDQVPPSGTRAGEREVRPRNFLVEQLPEGESQKSLSEYLPYYSMAVAAGGFLAGDAPEPEGWVHATQHGFSKRPSRGMFVTQVVGKSMEPTIHDGLLCVSDRRGRDQAATSRARPEAEFHRSRDRRQLHG